MALNLRTSAAGDAIPADIWAALRIAPGALVHWELRQGEAIMRPVESSALDDVFGMLKPFLKKASRPPTLAQARARAKVRVGEKFRQSLNAQ